MAIGSDFEIQNDKDIRYTGTTTNYTVLELHRWLQDLADNASVTPDDYMDITRDTPSDKSFDTIINLINGYNIDDTTAQHLYGGSIIQGNGAEIYDGIQVLAPAGMYLSIIQDGALATNFWTTGINADAPNGISHQFMIKVRTAGADIDGRRLIGLSREWQKTYLEFKINGTARGVNVMAFTGWATDLNNQTDIGSMTGSPYTSVNLVTAGYVGIDANDDTTNEYFYSEWDRGSCTINQFYETLKYKSRRGETAHLYGIDGEMFRGITDEYTCTQGSGTFATPELLTWSGGTGQVLAVNHTTAATKVWIQLLTGVPLTSGAATAAGGAAITVSANTSRTVSAPFVGVSTGSSIIGAFGLGIQKADLSAADKVFDLTGAQITPPNNVVFAVGGLEAGEDYVLVGPLGYRFKYDGETGTSFTIGETLTFTSPAGTAKLVAILDLGTTGEMTIGPMLTGSVPTDNSTIAGGSANADVDGTVSNAVNLRQFTLNGALTGAAVTSVVVNETIPGDTPKPTGSIRILRADGQYSRHAYTGWSGSTFTIGSTDFSSNNAANGANAFISYVDKLAASDTESFTGVYVSSRDLFIRVRDGGATPIKTFESKGTLGAAGGTATAVRTSDA